jgi:membrane-bound ClpP family serine protease
MIIVGLILLLIGFIAGIPILWTAGVIVLVIGVILMLLGRSGHRVGGRAHYF